MADRIALVGAETLLGREIEDVLAHSTPRLLITSYAANGEGNFGSEDGEAVFMEPLDPATTRDHSAIVIAGTVEGANKAYDLVKQASSPPQLIDATGHLENKPEARIGSSISKPSNWLTIVPHPAAFALATVLGQLARHAPVARSLVNIFEPASEQGQKGIHELQQQTSSLLSFKPLEQKIYDAQLAFNLLARYGDEAPVKLSAIEQRIELHTATLLNQQHESGKIIAPPMPSLRLLQAPVFHGYSISLWVEFQSAVDIASLDDALASSQIDVRDASTDAPTSAGAASQNGLLVGDIRVDRNNSRAAWFWIVFDNLRLRADGIAALLGTSQEAGR